MSRGGTAEEGAARHVREPRDSAWGRRILRGSTPGVGNPTTFQVAAVAICWLGRLGGSKLELCIFVYAFLLCMGSQLEVLYHDRTYSNIQSMSFQFHPPLSSLPEFPSIPSLSFYFAPWPPWRDLPRLCGSGKEQ